MHTKYTSQQIKNFEQKHDEQVEKFHRRQLNSKRMKALTKIGNSFKGKLYHYHKINQYTVLRHLKNDISTHAEILIDNWIMSLHAWKNRFAFNEDHKRWEKYLIYKYKKN
jgi:hypothetical protein